jgi:hypothetical protein
MSEGIDRFAQPTCLDGTDRDTALLEAAAEPSARRIQYVPQVSPPSAVDPWHLAAEVHDRLPAVRQTPQLINDRMDETNNFLFRQAFRLPSAIP